MEKEKAQRVWIVPFALILAWEIFYVAMDKAPGIDSKVRLFSIPLLFLLEFAVLFSLSLWLGAYLSRKRGLSLRETFEGFAIFFSVYLLLALAGTLMTTAGLMESGRLLASLGFFVVLSLVKLVIGAIGAAAGFYMPKKGEWAGFPLYGAALTVLVLLAALVPGAALGYYFAQTTSYSQSPNFSYSVENCASGEWMYLQIFGYDFNITVIGLDTYRNRTVCHASGNTSFSNYTMTMDVYGVSDEDRCLVTFDGRKTTEKCKGDWPGYTGSQD